ncbi:MAG: nlpI [Verrucomicrobiales bacterium]|nr:nlpI [Verrucomicrobiales bacterium]
MGMKRRCFLLTGLAAAAGGGILRAEESAMAEGTRAFMEGKIEEALRHWDRQIAEDPESGPHHWQRGLALYYAGRYKEGREQFEAHRKVNPEDVENAAWHFLCVARQESPAAARKVFIPIGRDGRVPMKEIHALYAGTGTVEAVRAAAEVGAEEPVAGGGGDPANAAKPASDAKNVSGESPRPRKISAGELRNQRCYSGLYLGLYHEVMGDAAKAEKAMVEAAGKYRMDHYMGKVAQVHCQLRGWKIPV